MAVTVVTALSLAVSLLHPASILGVAAAPLEPADGKLLLGAWYDRNNSDTPSAVNARLGYKPFSFFQTDIDFSGTLKPWTAPNITTQFLSQLQDTSTDAWAMLTVYPFQGFSAITDAQLDDMATRMNTIVNSGRSIFFRFASEMNGSWFPYGQDPIGFIAAWQRCITYWRKALGSNASKVAFIWSPNSGNGYPYLNEEYSINQNATDAATVANLKALDTNGNGVLDSLDDPYIPYYPGDDYVDWVGISVYHYGLQWPWVDNVVPILGKFEDYLQGVEDPTLGQLYGYYPFYTYFSSSTGCVNNITGAKASSGGKPLIISETAAVYHFAWVNSSTAGTPGEGETATPLEIKQGWWRQFLNTTFLDKYPMMKAVSTFEFIKTEELTWRDFTTVGGPNPNTAVNLTSFDSATAAGLAKDLASMSFIRFANATSSGTSTKTSSASSIASSAASRAIVACAAVGGLMLAAWC